MNKSLAIAVSLCFIALSVSDVEAGIFGRRSRSCRGGNCSQYSAPSYSTYNQPVTYSNRTVTVAKPVSQPVNGNAVQSPSDLPATQSAPAPAPRATYSSPCAGGNCYARPVYSSPCAGGNCSSGSYQSRGWFRR